jgi:hypothetical protein
MNREVLHDLSQLLVSLVLLGGSFAFLYGVFFSGHNIDPGSKESLTQVTGGVLAIISGVAGFWIGTSLSSLRKDSAISKSKETTSA